MDDVRPRRRAESAPASLWSIALLALAPFPLAALAYAYGRAEVAAPGLMVILTWSAVILAFLGGVRWGLETARPAPRPSRLAASVVSPVFAWILFLCRGQLPVSWLLAGFLLAFLLQWMFDHSASDVPVRWPRLMTMLTAGAAISLAIALERALKV